MFSFYIFFILFISFISASEDQRTVQLDIGFVHGDKYWNGDYYEFYGIPYATVPKGRDKYKAPLPVEPFGNLVANKRDIKCPQVYLLDEEDEEVILDGDEDCLAMNIFVPEEASEKNLLPVLVYIHSGSYSGGHANMGRLHYLTRQDVVTINFNYRLGFPGFACLGTEEIPGNAGLKDQVAALKFINKYISKFGGDPNKVTLAGYSVGAVMAELHTLSKATTGLFNQLILESASALTPFAINRHPIETARNMAISIGFNDTGNIKDLTEFLLTADTTNLAQKSKNFFLTNSTLGLAPCIESAIDGVEPFLTESPLTILHKGDYKQIPILTGFANMEGISRTFKVSQWSKMMNENFADFLPADLKFDNEASRDALIKDIKKIYFKDEKISLDTLKEYVDYFSDSMFKYGIMKSAKLHSLKSSHPVFLYEFTYVGHLNMKHDYMDKLKGASHRDQTTYVLDFYDSTSSLSDMNTRDRLTTMWTDFVKYGNPTTYESVLFDVKWAKYTKEDQSYLRIGRNLEMKKDLFEKRYTFWNKVYDQYYWNPTPVVETKSKE